MKILRFFRKHKLVSLPVVFTLLLSTVLATVTGCGASSSSTTQSTGSNGSNTITVVDTVSGANMQAFWKEYLIPKIKSDLGIDVKYTVGSGPEIVEQMKAWKPDQPEFSLLFVRGLDLSNIMTGSGDQLVKLYPDLKSTITNEAHESASDLASNNGVPLNGSGLMFWHSQFALVYNSKYITNPPKTWEEFYNDRNLYKGHIGIIRPDASSGGGRAFIYSFLKANGLDVNQPLADLQKSPQWQQVWSKFENFSQAFANPAASSPPVLFQQIVSGQVWITDYAQDYSIWSSDQGMLPPTIKTAALDVNISGASNAWLAVPAVDSSAQKTAAYKVINLLLSPEVQLHLLQVMHEYPGTDAWKNAPASDFAKIAPVDVALSHDIRMNNFDLLKFIQQHGMDYVK